MSIAKQIGARIKRLRQRAKMSQMDVAHKAGVATSYFSALERGEKNATIGTLAQVAAALGATFEDLVAGELVEVEKLLAEVPLRLRHSTTELLRDTLTVIREAAREPSSRRKP